MACGAPVVAADACSLTEVTADAGLLVNPNDEQQIANALLSLCNNPELRQKMIARGLAHAAKFTWRNTAAQHFEAYRIAMQQR
jgi:glycosyltransferase involved in cell wall biosynthesis